MKLWLMKRHDSERNAAEYVSGELPGRIQRWFERHLLECEDCWPEVLLDRFGRRPRMPASPSRWVSATGYTGCGHAVLGLIYGSIRGRGSCSAAVRVRLCERLSELLTEAAVADHMPAIVALAEGAELDPGATACALQARPNLRRARRPVSHHSSSPW